MDVTTEPSDGTIPVFIIWYGNWAAEEQSTNRAYTQALVNRFIPGMSGSECVLRCPLLSHPG